MDVGILASGNAFKKFEKATSAFKVRTHIFISPTLL
jgi:hypothetical protein